KEAHRISPEAGGVTDAKQLSHAAAVGVAVKDLVEYVAKALVDEPEQVNVTEVEGERVTVIELRVAQTDLGKVIGKQGRTARALGRGAGPPRAVPRDGGTAAGRGARRRHRRVRDAGGRGGPDRATARRARGRGAAAARGSFLSLAAGGLPRVDGGRTGRWSRAARGTSAGPGSVGRGGRGARAPRAGGARDRARRGSQGSAGRDPSARRVTGPIRRHR